MPSLFNYRELSKPIFAIFGKTDRKADLVPGTAGVPACWLPNTSQNGKGGRLLVAQQLPEWQAARGDACAPSTVRHCSSLGCSACGVNSSSLALTCLSVPSRRIVKVTSVPGDVPAIRFRNEFGSVTVEPFSPEITSPCFKPARSAALPGLT